MRVLGLDIGSSSVKAAILTDAVVTSSSPDSAGHIAAGPVRVDYPSRFAGVRAEIDPPVLLAAVQRAVAELGSAARGVDLIAFATLSPAWLAMDAHGEPLTPLVTHADRRSIASARDLERRIGADRHLALTGNRPFPGGMASTTWAWYSHHAPDLMRRADLVGMLPTYLLRRLAGTRVIDPSNASFLGVYATLSQGGWVPELVEAAGGRLDQLPEIVPADAVAGRLSAPGAAALGLRAGTPVLAGCVDGSAAMLGAGLAAGGLRAGQLVDVIGSTDVLAMCSDAPVPHERLLTRALGTGRRWASVATLASVGSTLEWVHRTLFADLDITRFRALVGEAAEAPDPAGVTFAPYLAGERTAVEQRAGAFSGLRLATTRQHLLSAVVEALAGASAQRLALLALAGRPLPTVYLTGGAGRSLAAVVHRDWPPAPGTRPWDFVPISEATLRGLLALATAANGREQPGPRSDGVRPDG